MLCDTTMQNARDTYRDACEKLDLPLHRDIVERFIRVQILLLTPLCPHWCEHIWCTLLGGDFSVRRAAWPVAEPVDEALSRASAYLQERLRSWRLLILKGERKKGKKKAGPVSVCERVREILGMNR
jgi:leucyl-tRNA synthetase